MMIKGKELPLSVTREDVVFIPSEEGITVYLRDFPEIFEEEESEEEALQTLNDLLKTLKTLR